MLPRRRDDGPGCVINFVQIEGGRRREVSLVLDEMRKNKAGTGCPR